MEGKHGRTMLGVTCHHRLWTTHTVERRRRGMLSCLWRAHTIERRRAWYDITTFGQHTWSNDVGLGMTSPLLDCTDNQQRRAWHDITAIGQHTVERRQAWHNITALGQHTRLDYVRRGMTSLPLYNTHGRMTSGVACHHRL